MLRNKKKFQHNGIFKTGFNNYVADKKLHTVFTSNFKRAILTGLSFGLPQIPLDHSPQTKLESFVTRIKNIHGTKNILVVGHINTVTAIVQALSGQQIRAIAESEYNNMYIITIRGKEITLVHTTYGR